MLIELRESNDLAMRLEFFLRKTNSTLISLFSFVITFFIVVIAGRNRCCRLSSSTIFPQKYEESTHQFV